MRFLRVIEQHFPFGRTLGTDLTPKAELGVMEVPPHRADFPNRAGHLAGMPFGTHGHIARDCGKRSRRRWAKVWAGGSFERQNFDEAFAEPQVVAVALQFGIHSEEIDELIVFETHCVRDRTIRIEHPAQET